MPGAVDSGVMGSLLQSAERPADGAGQMASCDEQDRDRGTADDGLGDATEEPALETGPTVAGHHDDVTGLGHLDMVVRGSTPCRTSVLVSTPSFCNRSLGATRRSCASAKSPESVSSK